MESIIIQNNLESSNLLQQLSEDDSSSDDDVLLALVLSKQCKRKRSRISDYIPKVVKSYTAREFRAHFRLSWNLFHSLLGCFEHSKVMRKKETGRPHTDCEKMLLMSLWYMANTETHRQLADRFGICEFTVFPFN